jgi:hypothetical protein
MDTQCSYRVLIHTARGVQALSADGIDSCLPLPRLTPLEQTAPCVLGAFDLRGELVPVISVGLLIGERPPRAAPTDLVLVVLAATFPVGVHSPRPLRIDTLRTPGTGARWVIDISSLRLTMPDMEGRPNAETRLARFERGLTPRALRRLEQRAGRYGEFATPRTPLGPAALPARS